MFRAWRMSRWRSVSSVRCRKVPAGPVKVPARIRSSSRPISGQVSWQAFSALATEAEMACGGQVALARHLTQIPVPSLLPPATR